MQKGYSVGQLGIEPTSKLFRFDEVFPIGYNSVVSTSGADSISILNNLIYNIEEKQPDIIISGSQSNIIPRQIRNLKDIPYNGYEYLLGINPDCAIVCVNYEDDIDFIKRTIDYVQGLTQTVVLSIVLFPLKKNLTWS